ncbi:lactosylceramide 1,3-N-acetyl-beta-D-glucosaminyltransferase-like [Aplysia californica]|uniref:Hexosyltransferase n=1 Tax=Aplysia californica TaxID=6500 RepID=A0ABM0KAP4_APLCA|nr:lactosylceramide 1,3-N-acetyl-beta-D-glucosaminyltransferase-like [Aplysia californica]
MTSPAMSRCAPTRHLHNVTFLVICCSAMTSFLLLLHVTQTGSPRHTDLLSDATYDDDTRGLNQHAGATRPRRERTPTSGVMPDISEVTTLHPSLREFLARPVINPHPFTYLLTPERTCEAGHVTFLFSVPSAPSNFQRRRKVRRSSLATFAKNPGNNASLLFFLGSPPGHSKRANNTRAQIYKEARNYQDMVLENFPDIYRNIRLKAVSMLKWTSTYCHTALYVIRTDDDVGVDVMNLVQAIRHVGRGRDNFILGHVVENSKLIRRESSKYFISREEYAEDTWPKFALGGVLGYPVKTVRLLYEASLRVKAVWLEDVYITALCGRAVNATLLSHPLFTFVH